MESDGQIGSITSQVDESYPYKHTNLQPPLLFQLEKLRDTFWKQWRGLHDVEGRTWEDQYGWQWSEPDIVVEESKH